MAWWRSGNAAVCKTAIRGFDSRPRLIDIILVYYSSNDNINTRNIGGIFILFIFKQTNNAGVAKLVDALALGASGVTHGGSSPLPGTSQQKNDFQKEVIFLLIIYLCAQ